jgi:hypothetical protein
MTVGMDNAKARPSLQALSGGGHSLSVIAGYDGYPPYRRSERGRQRAVQKHPAAPRRLQLAAAEPPPSARSQDQRLQYGYSRCARPCHRRHFHPIINAT